MNQTTHAWLAIEAYKKIRAFAKTEKGIKKKANKFVELLGSDLKNVVLGCWLPDSLIKDMTYGHVFKNSIYKGDQKERFKLLKDDLRKKISTDSAVAATAFDLIPEEWWQVPYRAKQNGGHLPARISSLSQSIRDMLKMGDSEVNSITGKKSYGSSVISKSYLFTKENISSYFWIISHYIADAHMPFHCDNRGLASTDEQKLHGAVEDLWGEELPDELYSKYKGINFRTNL